LVVRNGHGVERPLQTGLGAIGVRAPRVDDRRAGQRFTSQILPPYLRRVPSLENLIPVLYLKGLSSSAMPAALAPLLGPNAAGLSSATIVRLIAGWQDEYQVWRKRDLRQGAIVCLWADGIDCNVRLTDERPCLPVVMGARKDGTKVLLALEDGERESELSWLGVLQDLKGRGLKAPPKLAVADASGRPWRRSGLRAGRSGAGCPKRPTSSTSSRSNSNPRPRNGCMRFGWRIRGRMPLPPLIDSSSSMQRNTRRRAPA
jgi:transposase-like protein